MKLTCYWITHKMSESVQCNVGMNRFAAKVFQIYIKYYSGNMQKAFHYKHHQPAWNNKLV